MLIALNVNTKEHRRWDESFNNTSDWVTLSADEEGWIKWSGGECPLPDNAFCDIETTSGLRYFIKQTGTLKWEDVAAYRPVLDDDKQPAPVWDGTGYPPIGTECETNSGSVSDYFWCKVVAFHYETGRPILRTEFMDLLGAVTHAPECWKFRPLPTEEDKAVKAMLADIEKATSPDDICDDTFARALYRAGYRKTT